MLQAQVLAAVVPADVHQLDRVERALAAPWRPGAMRGLPRERVLDRHQPGALSNAPRRAELVVDVGEERDVDVLEQPVAHIPGFRAHQFLGDAWPEAQRARQLLALHQLLHRDGSRDVERDAGVVAFAVPWGTVDQRVAIGDARLLRALGDAVDVRAEGDHRLAAAPFGDPRRGDARDAARDPEAVLLEDAGEVARRLDLLKAQLAEAEHGVHHLLGQRRQAVDVGGGLLLERGETQLFLRGRCRLGRPF